MNTEIKQLAAEALTDDVKYPLPSSIGNLVSGIRTIVINSDKSNYEDQGEIITIEIHSSSEFLDCLRSYLTFTLNIVNPQPNAATTARLTGPTTRLFSRCRVITASGLVISDVDRFDVLSEILFRNIPPQYQDSVDGLISGQIVDQRVATGIRYYLPLYASGILSSRKFLPLLAMGSIRLELTLNSAFNALKFDAAGSTAGIRISQVRYHACLVQMRDQLNASLKSIINDPNKKLLIPYFDYHNQNFNIQDANSIVNLDLRKAASDIRSLYAMVRDSSELGREHVKFESVTGTGVKGVQARVGSHNFPIEKPMDDVAEQYIEFRKAFNQFGHIVHPSVTYDEYKGTSHVLAIDLEVIPSSYGSGISSMGGEFINLQLSTATAPAVVNTYLLYSKQLQILPNKVIQVNE